MAQIASGNVEIYISQLLSESMSNDVDSRKQAMAEKFLKDDNSRKAQEKNKMINKFRIPNQEWK